MKYTVDEIAEMRKYIVSMGDSEWQIRYPNEGGCYSAEQVESQIQTFMANETKPDELRIAAEKQAIKALAAVADDNAARKKAQAAQAARAAAEFMEVRSAEPPKKRWFEGLFA